MRNFSVLSFSLILSWSALFAQQDSASATQVASQKPAVAQGSKTVENDADPLLDLPPLPKGHVSLIGGTVVGVDRIRDHITLKPFGGKSKMKLAFDERTHIYRDGVETTQLGIKKGDRVYVDSQLVGSIVFARNIRVENNAGPAFVQGQIARYDPQHGTIVLRDRLSSEETTFRLTPKTVFSGKASSAADLKVGALIAMKFEPGKDRQDGAVIQEITLNARPGETFYFAGPVTHLDMRSGLVVIRSDADGKTYDIRFDPGSRSVESVAVGSQLRINAEFDGTDYRAREIEVMQSSGSPSAISDKQ